MLLVIAVGVSLSDTPTTGSPAQPPPPTAGNNPAGGRDHEEDKLTVMFCLSLFIWMRLRALSGFSRLKVSYVQTLLEELTEEGLVWIGSDPPPRMPRLSIPMSRLGRKFFRSNLPPVGSQLRIGLTEAGRAHPPLMELKDQTERDRSEQRTLTRWQRLLCQSVMVTITALIVAHVGVSAVLIIYL